MTIDFTPHAVYDIDSAAEYLEVEKDGGGARFKADLTKVLDRLEQFPESAELFDPPAEKQPGLRVTVLSKFDRYTVYYRPTPDGILVVRVLHGSRNAAVIFGPDPDPPE